jgi:E3 ubiquitin ligase SMURF1/2/E3 ubiquitin-protein ligase NEDD4
MSAGLQQKNGWTRTLGLDNYVHWTRPSTQSDGSLASNAWVRSIAADHTITWRTAAEGYAVEGMQCPPYFDLTAHQQKAKLPFSKKLSWFREEINRLRVPWDVAHKKITVSRRNLLEDSASQIMKLSPINFREIFRFKFAGEPALDAGGVAREWYETITETLFNLDFGLFTFSGTDCYSYGIKVDSAIANEHHLHYFRFAGRLLGKALFDGQLVEAHLVRPMYKHIIGAPIDLDDMEFVNRDTYQSLKWIRDNEDADEVGVTFSVSRSMFGETIIVDLKPGGRDIDVDDDNKAEYIDLMIKYTMFGSVKDQLQALLRGFYEVVPAFLVSVFDFQELELLLCGLPQIDIEDWKKHMRYRGEYNANHKIVKWFFECVSELSHAEQAKLLQFATGSSAVPVEGFQALQSHDGKLCWFALQSAKLKDQQFIIAHTCFNRLDLPMYKSKKVLKEQLDFVLSMEVSGFGIE